MLKLWIESEIMCGQKRSIIEMSQLGKGVGSGRGEEGCVCEEDLASLLKVLRL